MKHPFSTTALLIALFVASQLIGIALLARSGTVTDIDGERSVSYGDTTIGARPETEGAGSFLFIIIGVAIGTALVMLLIKFKAFRFWKVWFALAVWLSTSVAVGVMIPSTIALVVCFAFALWKVFRPNPIVHNLTEIFMYAGIAILLAPLFTLGWVIALLIVISVYDVIAVWYSKHMVTMAQEQSRNNLFAGLAIPKSVERNNAVPAPSPGDKHRAAAHISTASPSRKKPASSPADAGQNPVAILGGGDIAFPLIFSGVAMDWLIAGGMAEVSALYATLLITAGATAALTGLFLFAKKDRFYPAMPFLSAGCFIGLALIVLLF